MLAAYLSLSEVSLYIVLLYGFMAVAGIFLLVHGNKTFHKYSNWFALDQHSYITYIRTAF